MSLCVCVSVSDVLKSHLDLLLSLGQMFALGCQGKQETTVISMQIIGRRVQGAKMSQIIVAISFGNSKWIIQHPCLIRILHKVPALVLLYCIPCPVCLNVLPAQTCFNSGRAHWMQKTIKYVGQLELYDQGWENLWRCMFLCRFYVYVSAISIHSMVLPYIWVKQLTCVIDTLYTHTQ